MISSETPFQRKINDEMERLFGKHFPSLPYPEAAERFAEIGAGGVSPQTLRYALVYTGKTPPPW